MLFNGQQYHLGRHFNANYSSHSTALPQNPPFPYHTNPDATSPSEQGPALKFPLLQRDPARIALPGSLVMLRAIDKNNTESIVLLFIHGKVKSTKASGPWGSAGDDDPVPPACPWRCHGGTTAGQRKSRLLEDKRGFSKSPKGSSKGKKAPSGPLCSQCPASP